MLFPCRTCARDPSDVISRRVQDMFELFSQHFEGSGAENRGMGKGTCAHKLMNRTRTVPLCLMSDVNVLLVEMAVKYFHLAEALYYRILESIIEREKMILGDADLSVSVFFPETFIYPHTFCLISILL